MKFSSVLFDLDGTLLKTADDLGAALNFVLRQYNKPEVSAQLYTPEASNGSKGLLQLGFGESFEHWYVPCPTDQGRTDLCQGQASRMAI